MQQVGLKPGRIVYFVVDGESAARINHGRDDPAGRPPGLQAQVVGNRVAAGDVVPAMVTRVWGGDVVNLKVMLDGDDTYWATSIRFSEAKEYGTFHWMFEGQRERYQPDRVEAKRAEEGT